MNRNFLYCFRGNRIIFIQKILAKALGAAAAVLMIGLTAFCAQPEPPPQQLSTVWDGVYTTEQAKRGREIGAKECGGCHGEKLIGGNDDAGTLMGDTFLSVWSDLTVGDLFERMRNTMPQQDPGRLSNQQYADVLAYILSINDLPTGNTELGAQQEILKQILIKEFDPRPPQTTGPTATSIESGEQLFARVGCAGCHGTSANVGAASQLTATRIPLSEFIKSVRQPPGKMTPFSREKVSDAQLADIYAFLHSFKTGLPAGPPVRNTDSQNQSH